MSESENRITEDTGYEKLPDRGIIPQSERMKKFDNFWYYNKWKIIVIAFVLIVFLVCALQMCESNKIDSFVMYSGPYNMLDSTAVNGMRAAFAAVLPYELNGDGYKEVQLITTYVLSDEQIESIRDVTDEQGSQIYYPDVTFNKNELKQFDSLILAGDYSVCLLDPFLYERVKSSNGFVKLSDVFDSIPEGAIDEYGIRFSDTEFAKYYEVFSVLPSDTVLCLRTPSTFAGGSNANSKEYQLSKDLFKAIVEFIPQ